MKTAMNVMTTKMVTVPPTMNLVELASLLQKRRITGCPVVDEDGVVVGVVSQTDLTRARAKGDDFVDLFYSSSGFDTFLSDEYAPYPDGDDESLQELSVGDVMNTEVQYVPADTAVGEVASKMLERRVHRLLVTDRGRFVGIVSSTDLLKVLADG